MANEQSEMSFASAMAAKSGKGDVVTSRKRSPHDAFEDSGRGSNKKQAVEDKQDPLRTKSANGKGLHISESDGDLFDAPAGSLLIHACNAKGSWGAGIAKAFKQNYPAAFEIYRKHCHSHKNSQQLVGTALLIPPAETDSTGRSSRSQSKSNNSRHFIGCLFTSYGFGKAKAKPGQIIEATRTSMVDILQQAQKWNSTLLKKKSDENDKDGTDDAKDAEITKETRIKCIQMCRINSGLFGVPWERTREVLESIEFGDANADADVNLRRIQVILHD